MPTIDVSHSDLCHLMRESVPVEKIREEGILFAKGEIESDARGTLKIDIKDTNRPDLWSAEGVARAMAGHYKAGGLPVYDIGKATTEVKVSPKVRGVRPCTVCAVVRGLDVTEETLSQMIQLQEKISVTFGRNRKEVAIGVYDMSRIKSPIEYTTVAPAGIKFVPLDFQKEMTPKEILEQHPKGKEHAHLLEGCKEYPIFKDASGQVLSMPPIINSDWTGKVTGNTRDLFIECSGFSLKFLMPALNTVVAALADRGGKIEAVKVTMPGGKTLITPDMSPKKASMDTEYANRMSGLDLKPEQMARLLEKARYRATVKGKKIELLYPAYRQDIMHQADIVEDMIVAYGYNNITPEIPRIPTIGGASPIEVFTGRVASLMVGLGCQEILSYTLTNRDALFRKMNIPEERVVEIENTVSSTWSVFRNRLVPGLLDFLSRNKHVDYPQKIFEVGDAVIPDSTKETRARNVRHLAFAVSDGNAGYENAVSALHALMAGLGTKYSLKRVSHPSFIAGRAAKIHAAGRDIGLVGEIHPAVLEKWEIDNPVAVFEVGLIH
jgi:phenylalanyl-tRNA synthetase beta chain